LWEPVFQNEGSHADGIEKRGGLLALGIENQFAKTAAWSDDDRAAVGLSFGWREDGDRGIVDVAHPPVLGLFGFVFAVFKTGRAVFPEVDNLWLCLSECGQRQRENDKKTEELGVHAGLVMETLRGMPSGSTGFVGGSGSRECRRF